MKLESILPEIDLIKDKGIKEKTKAVIADAIKIGKWKDISKVPRMDAWSCKAYGESLVDHSGLVTRIAVAMAKEMNSAGYDVNTDELISACILHDIGMLLEFDPKKGGGIKKHWGRTLIRHPLIGMWLALKHGLPINVAHAISAHSKEGDYTERTPEATILYYADWVIYVPLKSKNEGGR